MKFLKQFLLLWFIFAFLDPDPDPENGSGSTDPIESGSNWDLDPDPRPCYTEDIFCYHTVETKRIEKKEARAGFLYGAKNNNLLKEKCLILPRRQV